MKLGDNEKITLSQWNELTLYKKEVLRKWSIENGYGLDMVPGTSGSFDPICEYAALLTKTQLIKFLKSCDSGTNNERYKDTYKWNITELWGKAKLAIV